MALSSKLLNFHEPYIVSGGIEKTKVYTEHRTDIEVGSKVFFVGGSYDNYVLGIGANDPYALYADGYDVLAVDSLNNYVVIDYPYDSTKTVYSLTPVNGLTDAYLSKGYFRAGEFNGGNLNDGIVGQHKFVETDGVTSVDFLDNLGDYYIIIDQAFFFELNSTGLGKVSINDKLVVQYARVGPAIDNDGIYSVLEIIPPNTLGITTASQYAFKVLEQVINASNFRVEIQRTNSVTFGNKATSPKINHCVWHGGNYKKGTFDSKTDSYPSSYKFKKAEVTGSVVNVIDLVSTSINNFGLGQNVWLSGCAENIDWKNGDWRKGGWTTGDFRKGEFHGGLWLNGTKHNGRFLTDDTYVRWYDGSHLGGTIADAFYEDGSFIGGEWLGASGIKISKVDLDGLGFLRVTVEPRYVKIFDNEFPVLLSYLKSNNSYNNEALDNPNMKRYVVQSVNYTTGEITLDANFGVSLATNLDYSNSLLSNSYFSGGEFDGASWKGGMLWSGYRLSSFDDTVSGQLTVDCNVDLQLPNDSIIKVGDTVYLANLQYNDGFNDISLDDIPLTVLNVTGGLHTSLIFVLSITPLAQNTVTTIGFSGFFLNRARWINGNFYSGRMLNSNFRNGNVYAQLNAILDPYMTMHEDGWWSVIPSTAIGPNVTWHDGVWLGGNFRNGDWLNGIMMASLPVFSFEATFTEQPVYPQLAYSARWFNGVWKNGTFKTGEWQNGDFQFGIWASGLVIREHNETYVQRLSSGVVTTSQTEHYTSTGLKTFLVGYGLDYTVGSSIDIVPTVGGGPTLQGTVFSYTGTHLIVNISLITGTNRGVFSDWTITQFHKTFEFSGSPAFYWYEGLNFNIIGTTIGDDGNYTVRRVDTFGGNTRIVTTTISGLIPITLDGAVTTIDYTGNSVNIFQQGTFSGVTWQNGIFNNGTFNNGNWLNGIFNNGTFIGPTTTMSNGKIYGGIIDSTTIFTTEAFSGTIKNSFWQSGYANGATIIDTTYWGLLDGGTMTGGSLDGGAIMTNGICNSVTFTSGTMYGGIFNNGYFATFAEMQGGTVDGTILDSGFIYDGVMQNVIAEGASISGGEWKSGTFKAGLMFGNVEMSLDTLLQDQSYSGTQFYMAKSGTQPFSNGNFASGLTGWSNLGLGTWTASSGGARWTWLGVQTGELAVTTPPLTVGEYYIVSVRVISNTAPKPETASIGTTVRIIAGPTTIAGNNFFLRKTSAGIYTGIVQANGTNFRIQTVSTSGLSGNILIDDVVCKPLNNASLLASQPTNTFGEVPVWVSNVNYNGTALINRCLLIEKNTNINQGYYKIFANNTVGTITQKNAGYSKFPVSAVVWNTGTFSSGDITSIWRNGNMLPDNPIITSVFHDGVWENGTCGYPISTAVEVTGTELLTNGDFVSGGTGWLSSGFSFGSNLGLTFAYTANTACTSLSNISKPNESLLPVTRSPILTTGLSHLALGSVLIFYDLINTDYWFKAILTAYNPGTGASTVIIFEKNGEGGSSSSAWSVVPEEITRQTYTISQNVLTNNSYYKTTVNGFISDEYRNFVKFNYGTNDYALTAMKNAASQVVPKTFISKANGTAFTVEHIHDNFGSNLVLPISIKEILVPELNNVDWIYGTLQTGHFNTGTMVIGTVHNGIMENVTMNNGIVNYGRLKDCNLTNVGFYDGHFSGTTNLTASMNVCTIFDGFFEKGTLDECNLFENGHLNQGYIKDGANGSFNSGSRFVLGDVFIEDGTFAEIQYPLIQFVSLPVSPPDSAGKTITIKKNGLTLFTLTSSLNYAIDSFPALGYSSANWGANQPANIITTVRAGANWAVDDWRLILRDVLEAKINAFSDGSDYFVQFGDNRGTSTVIVNYGETGEVPPTLTNMYILYNNIPTSTITYTKTGTSALVSPIVLRNGQAGNKMRKVVNDTFSDIIAGSATSTSSHSATVGSKLFVVDTNTSANMANSEFKKIVVKIYRLSAPATYMTGYVTARTGTSITVNVLYGTGSGPFTDWVIQAYYPPQTSTSCVFSGGSFGF